MGKMIWPRLRRRSSSMRTYKRKTTRGTKSLEVYELAAMEVMEKNRNYRDVAKEFELCHVSLFNFVKKKKMGAPAAMGYIKTRLVFNAEQEAIIAEYLLKCANIFFGLLPEDVKRLAYECAKFYNVEKIPKSWQVNEKAGNDWFTNFLKRNPRLAIRSPEATSLSRATSFNRTNVQNFFEKYKNVLERYKFQPSRIWNVDETGLTTVQKPKKIVAGKGIKQVGAVTSAERGVLVTLAVATNAIGNAIPCMFVFPRIRYNDIFVRNGPPECIGVGNQSGWMTQKEFVKFLDHFIHHVKPSKEDPVLLLLDNHSSHVNVEVVSKAKNNNIVLLSFPPHCSHRLQPLDVGVYGPLKSYMNKAQTSWMSSNPGKTMSIYDPGIVKEALPLALNPMNIINAFKKSGIWPYNEDVFQESDFAPSFVTDRPDPNNQNQSLVSVPPAENEVNCHNLSLHLENPEILNDMPNLDISITEVIAQMSNAPVAGPSGMQRDASSFSLEPVAGTSGMQRDANNFSLEPVAGPSGMQKDASSFSLEPVAGPSGMQRDANNFSLEPVAGPSGMQRDASNFSLEPVAGPSGMQKDASSFSLEPVAGPSGMQKDATNISLAPVAGPLGMQRDASDFVIETIRPLPKAPPRVSSNRKRVKKSAILTDTPEKNALEEEHHIRELKKKKIAEKKSNKENKKYKGKGKGKAKVDRKISKNGKIEKVKKKILKESSESEEDECFCIVCGISYNEDLSGGDWIQCVSCKDPS